MARVLFSRGRGEALGIETIPPSPRRVIGEPGSEAQVRREGEVDLRMRLLRKHPLILASALPPLVVSPQGDTALSLPAGRGGNPRHSCPRLPRTIPDRMVP